MTNNPDTLLPAAKASLTAFLEQILDTRARLEYDEPARTTFDEIIAASGPDDERLVVLGKSTDSAPFLVLMQPDWLTALSEAILGSAETEWNDATSELLTDVVSQAYEALQADLDVTIPDASALQLTPLSEINSIPGDLRPDEMTAIRFGVDIEDSYLDGSLLLPSNAKALLLEESENEDSGAERPTSEPADEAPSDPPTPKKDASGNGSDPQGKVDVAPASFPDLGTSKAGKAEDEIGNFDLLEDVNIKLSVELGRRKMPLNEILRLTQGSIVELDKLAGEPLQIYANDRLIAQGEAVVIDDQFGVRITQLATDDKTTMSSLL